jgi:hypothetical protein
MRRFISNFVELVKFITTMLRKGNDVKWTPEARSSFEKIKQALTDALVLISLNYSKEFFLFSFALNDTLVVVLLQNNSYGMEQPITFFIRVLRDVEFRYDMMEKQSHPLLKALKYFMVYVLHSKKKCSLKLCKRNSYSTSYRWEKK